MREVCAIDAKWFAPSFFNFGNPTKSSKHKKEQKEDPLRNKYLDPNECFKIKETSLQSSWKIWVNFVLLKNFVNYFMKKHSFFNHLKIKINEVFITILIFFLLVSHALI